MKVINTLIIVSSLLHLSVSAKNETNQSFSKAKRLLETEVYLNHRITLYCGAKFDSQKKLTLPLGFRSDKHVKRSKLVEWDHVYR